MTLDDLEAQVKPPTGDLRNDPDADTKKADFTAPEAESRVLFLNFGWFRYGTDDKGHAAALILAVLLLLVILVVILVGLAAAYFLQAQPDWLDRAFNWLDRVFTWLGSGFLLRNCRIV